MGADERNVESAAFSSSGQAGEIGTADVGEGGLLGSQLESGDGLIDSILGHLSVGGPFAAGACEKTRGGDGDKMAADKGFGVLGSGISDKGTDS